MLQKIQSIQITANFIMGLVVATIYDVDMYVSDNDRSRDALRHRAQGLRRSLKAGRGASKVAFPRRAWERSPRTSRGVFQSALTDQA